MDDRNLLAEQFEHQRPHLRAVAYRMLGSLEEADDAVQDTWLRLGRSDLDEVENLPAWLTRITARVSLNMLRARKVRREAATQVHIPDPVVAELDGADPEQLVLLGDSVGFALQVVLDTLPPPERLAFVLHDVFAVSFDEIAPIVDRTPTATRKLASRARRRIREQAPAPDCDLARQREVVEAFFAAAHEGDFDQLVAVLDPEVVLRADGGAGRPGALVMVRGPKAVAMRAVAFGRLSLDRRPVLVNGAAGVVTFSGGRPFSIMGFTVVGSKIAQMNILSDPDRLRHIDLSGLNWSQHDQG